VSNIKNLDHRVGELETRRGILMQEITEIDTRLDELRRVRVWMADDPDDSEEYDDEEVEEYEEEDDDEEPKGYQMPTEMFGVDLTGLDERTRTRVMAGDRRTIETLGGTPPTPAPVAIARLTS